MDESKLNTTVRYKAKGNKTFKKYDAVVLEAVKEDYITVEVKSMSDSPIRLNWNDPDFTGDIFGNKFECSYDFERSFSARAVVTSDGGAPSERIKRKRSGYPVKR